MRDFIAFKKRTGGVLHQHKAIKVTPWNYEDVERLTEGKFKAIPHTKVVPDKRKKSGKREETYYTYLYWGTEYNSLKELNKHKVYITIDIHFDTLLDIIPYYPYIVSAACCNDGKESVFISSKSFVDEERDRHLEYGNYSDYWQSYKKDLQEHYKEVVLRYFNPEGREHVEEICFTEDGIGNTLKPIDPNFTVSWRWADGVNHTHWTSPEVIDYEKGIIRMSKQDLKLIGNKVLVYYVEAKEYPVILW